MQHRNYIHIASGDIIREYISAKSHLGVQFLHYVSRGELVPDELIIEVLSDYIQDKLDQNIIWDGFPRTINQAQKLDAMVQSHNATIDKVFYLEISEKQLLNRILGRLTCNNCGYTFHLISMPPQQAGICDNCGYRLSSRSDDTAQRYKMRLDTFNKWAPQLLSFYAKNNRVVKIKANLPADEITECILSYLDD